MARTHPAVDHLFEGALCVTGFPLVEFDRKPLDQHHLVGFAIGWNAELTLIQVMELVQFHLNGYAIFRNSDVKRWRSVIENDFLARAAKINRLRPRKPEGVRYGSIQEAISSAGSAFPLITIHQERINPEVCYVGKVRGGSQRTTKIVSISPQAEWEEEERYQNRDITLLEFGGAYETLLQRMASRVRSA